MISFLFRQWVNVRRSASLCDLPVGQFADTPVQPLREKYFAGAVGQIRGTGSRVYSTEGRCARHERGVGCGGRGGAERRAALARTAKPCGPEAPTLASSFA